jgi:hypothetical protein
MWGLEVLSTTSGWACGGFNSVQSSPTLLKTTNCTNWIYQTNSGVTNFLSFNDIRFADANNGWLVGGNGIIRYTTNAGVTPWTSQSSGTLFELLGVDFINTSTGYACGREGVILTTGNGGASWAAQRSSMTTGTIWELDMVDDTTGYAACDIGILKYIVNTPAQPIESLQPNVGGDIFKTGTKRFIIWQVQAGIAYFISGEINTKLASMDEVPKKLAAIEARYRDAQIARMDGVSVDYPDWHFNVRASNTEPLLRLNLEAATPELMEKRRDEILEVIRG